MGVAPKNHPHQVIARQRAAAAAPKGGGRNRQAIARQRDAFADAPPEETVPPRSGFPVRGANKRGVDDSVDDRETPDCVYVPLHEEFRFTLDPASSALNAKCDHYCTVSGFFSRETQLSGDDGLAHSWSGERVFVNPPFSGVRPWVEKGWDGAAELVCLLLPNNRAEQPFWQVCIEPYRDRPGSILTTRNLPRRRPFLHHGSVIGNRTSKAPPFGLTVVIWDRRRPTRA